MSHGCPECRKPCELHNVTRCLTCHNHPGECSYGGCTRRKSLRFEFSEEGRVYEVREFCRKHGTSPHYEWLRVGGSLVEKESKAAERVTAAAERFAPWLAASAGGA